MVRPKKHLGQHFLTDENIASKIAGSLSWQSESVIEVGPGTGVLTKYLLKQEAPMPFFFEVDDESVEYLLRKFPEIGQNLLHADFLKANLGSIPGTISVIGNFPYNISSQILFKVLENRDRVIEVVGMFQKEVAERIASPPGSKKYGILSVLLKAFYDVDYLFTVDPGVFFPPPKVKSAVIRMKRNETGKLECDEALFFRVVKTGFNQRRKTLRNALKQLGFGESEGLGSLMSKRAEQLSVEDFITLTQVLSSERERLRIG
ncbi:MAG: 16S rRNA (adenine(1518)-N(6)/adenine(1519)-N(6))-dimethyltransferase RsmA [Bacteroidota bacterium]